MKRAFKCCCCGVEFEVEAEEFIEGIHGVIYDSKGVKHVYVDPTTDKHCDACLDIIIAEQYGFIVAQ